MTEKEILNYLKKPYDKDLVDTLWIYLKNDKTFYLDYFLPCVDTARKFVKDKKFNPILLIQRVYLAVNSALKDKRIVFQYVDLPETFSTTVKYQVSQSFAKIIVSDWLGNEVKNGK